VTVDFVHPADDLSGYRLVVVPSLYLIDPESAANLRQYVASGGALLVSYFSGIVDENDAVYSGPAPGALRDVLGVEIHEFLPLHENEIVRLSDGSIGRTWADDLHLVSAKTSVSYESGPAAGGPAITRNDYETGVAWYISTRLDVEDLTTLITGILAERSIEIATMKPGLEVVTRVGADARYTFLINHSETESTFPLTGSDLLTGESFDREIAVPPGTVRVIRHNR
jgi:beta-galactosidase